MIAAPAKAEAEIDRLAKQAASAKADAEAILEQEAAQQPHSKPTKQQKPHCSPTRQQVGRTNC